MESKCRVDPSPWGVFISNASFSRVDLANCAWVDRLPRGFSVDDIIEDVAERCDHVGVPTERIFFTNTRLAAMAQTEFTAAGFASRSSFEMVHRRRTDVGPSKPVDVREAKTHEDLELVWRLIAESLATDGFSEEDARQILAFSPRRYRSLSVRLFIAELGGQPSGYASMFSRDKFGYVLDLHTREAGRRKGVGSALTLRVLEMSRAAGNRSTGLTTAFTNEPAQRMYRTLGFVTVGERRSYARDVPQ